jgi:hypothetical protein
MTTAAQTCRVSAFKVYTAWGPGGRGFDLDDPAIGLPVVQHAHDLGVNVICAHKGLALLNFEGTWNQPRDMTDLATVWRSLLADPVQAAHVLGKLLRRLGEDRVAHPGGFRQAHPEDHRVALAGSQS